MEVATTSLTQQTTSMGVLGRDDADHAGFDDIRSAAMAIAEAKTEGLDAWLGASLSTPLIGNTAPLRALIARGLDEIAALHVKYGVK